MAQAITVGACRPHKKYLAAMATLCHYGKDVPGADTQWAKDRALAALRFNLASHKSGNAHCTDAADWQERAHCFLINGISIPGDAIWLFASATPPCCTFDFKTAGRAPKAWIKRNIILSPIPMLLPCIFPSHCFLAARS